MARHRKLEPIRLEDLENNPCASGLENVLRFPVPPPIEPFPAPLEANPAAPEASPAIVSTRVDTIPSASPVSSSLTVSTPVDTDLTAEMPDPTIASAAPVTIPTRAETHRDFSTPVDTHPSFQTPNNTIPSASPVTVPTPVESHGDFGTPVDTKGDVSTPVDTILALPEPRLFLSRSKKRLFRPQWPADAHTDGEDRLYQFMWDNGQPHAPGVRVYCGSMTALARALGRDDRNTRPLIESLIRKLSIQIARDQDFKTGHPRMYFVFDYSEVALRRQKAGLEWALKNKGIQLLTAAEAAAMAAAETVRTPLETAALFPPR
jgi:hypothetical protein